MTRRLRAPRQARWLALAVAVLACAAFGATPAFAAPPDVCGPGGIMPVADVTAGMTGTGYTVVTGRDPQPFDVEVLGVLKDGIAPGRDMIVINATGPVIDAGHGIWAGMSGSPVYIDGKLVGAVAYGLNDGPSGIGGVTPAEDMLHVLDYPSATLARQATKVSLTTRLRERIAAATRTPLADVDSTLAQLKIPLAISGLPRNRLDFVRRAVDHDHLSVFPYAVGSTASGSGSGALQPGGNFAAALSYGDLTFAGVGTTTYVCGGDALAFGHPFFWQGNASFGAGDADSIGIIPGLFVSYKLANVDAHALGTVDQDRLAAIGTQLGVRPKIAPVTTTVTAIDSASGATTGQRTGESDLLVPDFVPFFSALHVLSNIDVTFDHIGKGTSVVAWRITGRRANGDAFSFERRNRFADAYDISYGSIFELADDLDAIQSNPYEKVRITSVDTEATVETAVHRYGITDVLVSVNGGRWHEGFAVVRPGSKLTIRTLVHPAESGDSGHIDLHMTVPRYARSGRLFVVGGESAASDYDCFFSDADCGDGKSGDGSLDGLLARLARQPRNNMVLAQFRGRFGQLQASRATWVEGPVHGAGDIYLQVKR